MLQPAALAYVTADETTADHLRERLRDRLPLEMLPIDENNRGELLVDMHVDPALPLILLVTDGFLRNPNALLGLPDLLDREAAAVIPLVPATDPDLMQRLADRSAVAYYTTLWEDRYIDLRRHSDSLAGDDAESFEDYLRRVRSVSQRMGEFCEGLYRRGLLYGDRLSDEEYRPLTELVRHWFNRKGARSRDAMPTEGASESGGPSIIEQAWRLADAGRVGEGLALLDNARQSDDEYAPELHYNYALLLAAEADRADEARVEVDRLLSSAPEHLDAHYLAAELALAAGDTAAARRHWEKLSDLAPYHRDVNGRLGLLLAHHFAEDHAAEAAGYLKRAVAHEPVDAQLLFDYAMLVHQRLDRPKRARKLFKKATKLDPAHAPAHYTLALLHYARDKHRLARKNFLIAAGLDPRYDTERNRRAFAARPVATDSPKTKPVHPPPASSSSPTVLISGATSGIGRATARRFAQAGYRLILTGRREERLSAAADEFTKDFKSEVRTLSFDVSSRAGVATAIDELPEGWQVDVLINNAGKAKGLSSIERGDLDHWDEMIDVNLRGLLYLTRAITPGMVARGRGMIINVASTAGKEVYPGGNVYCATKHAVDALTYAMRLDLVEHGIRVGQVCPAHVEETEFAEVRFDGDKERANIYEDFQPLRARDVAESIYFMASQPAHVNILDVVLQGTQQAHSTVIDRGGRDKFKPAEDA